jgi:hypothetical protein
VIYGGEVLFDGGAGAPVRWHWRPPWRGDVAQRGPMLNTTLVRGGVIKMWPPRRRAQCLWVLTSPSVDGWCLAHCDVWLGGRRLIAVGVRGGFGWSLALEWCAVVVVDNGRWWFDSYSSPVCEVVVNLGGNRWRAAEACWFGRGERRRQVGVGVAVELLLPSHSDEVCRFE